MEESERIKILMTADTIGGVWTYCMDLIGAMDNKVEVMLATMGQPLSYHQRTFLSNLPSVILEESNFKLEWMEDPWHDIALAGDWLIQLEREFQPDIIHLNNYCFGNLPWQAPVILVGHSCVLSWWEQVKKEPAPASWNAYRDKVMKGIQAADMVLAPSKYMMAFLDKYYGPIKNSRVVYNGKKFPEENPVEKERIIFSMGRLWDEAKNVSLLVKAAPMIDAPVFIAGDFSKGQFMDVPENVNFLGVLPGEEIYYWLNKAMVFALPVKYEPFGYTFLEAAQSGCIIITGNIGSMTEIWDDAVIKTDPEDPQELAEACNDALNFPGRKQGQIEKSKEIARRFSANAMAEEYLRSYQQIINKSKTLTI